MIDNTNKKKLEKASRLLAADQNRESADLCRHVLAKDPDHFAATRLLCRASEKLGDIPTMLAAAQRACEIRPRNVNAAIRLADCLFNAGHTRTALETLNTIDSTADDRHGALLRAAKCYSRHGLAQDAYRCHSRALDLQPDNYDGLLATAKAAADLGNDAVALKLLSRAIHINPAGHEAWYQRSMLRKANAGLNNSASIGFVLDNLTQDDPGRIPLLFALAKELDDLGKYEDVPAILASACAQHRATLSYSITDDQSLMRAQAKLEPTADSGHVDNDKDIAAPILIVGLPGSGAEVLNALLSLYPDAKIIYSEPDNILRQGRLLRSRPDTRVIHVHRDPGDNALAVLKTWSQFRCPWSYDLEEIQTWFCAYQALMESWQQQLGDRLLEVDLDLLLLDPKAQLSRIQQYLGIEPVAEAVSTLTGQQTETTGAATRIKRFLANYPSGQWRRYEEMLAPLEREKD